MLQTTKDLTPLTRKLLLCESFGYYEVTRYLVAVV